MNSLFMCGVITPSFSTQSPFRLPSGRSNYLSNVSTKEETQSSRCVREISNPDSLHSEVDEEDDGPATASSSSGETWHVQGIVSSSRLNESRLLLENVSDSVQKTRQVKKMKDSVVISNIVLLCRYSAQVPSYEQSVLALSRRIRNQSVPPPPSLSSSSSFVSRTRSPSRPPLTPPAITSRAYSPRPNSYTSKVSYTAKTYDCKREFSSRGFWLCQIECTFKSISIYPNIHN